VEKRVPETTSKKGPRRLNRRRFLLTALLAAPAAIAATTVDARWIEPQWIKTRHLRLSTNPSHRFVQFSDLHHKGDRAHTKSVVDKINALSPDFVIFTGDLIEESKFLPEALELISGIKTPMYGIPGNHDYWSRAPFGEYSKCFAATGGRWLVDQTTTIAGGKINLIGVAQLGPKRVLPVQQPGVKNILLIHYPAWAKAFTQKFDLILAGHSHGGQVRIPFHGPLFLGYGVDEYDMGLYHTQAGHSTSTPGSAGIPSQSASTAARKLR
jgi:predicted MPP superfamily phosphohydrolase